MTRDQRNILEILNPDRNRIKHKVREVPDLKNNTAVFS
jgi:hypothetical protein